MGVKSVWYFRLLFIYELYSRTQWNNKKKINRRKRRRKKSQTLNRNEIIDVN